MANYTANYQLYLPNRADDIEVDTSLSDNFQKIDTKMKDISNSVTNGTNNANAISLKNKPIEDTGLTNLDLLRYDANKGKWVAVRNSQASRREVVQARRDNGTSNQTVTIPKNVDTVITYDNKWDYRTGDADKSVSKGLLLDHLNLGTGKFTAPFEGWYQVFFTAYAIDQIEADKEVTAKLFKNNAYHRVLSHVSAMSTGVLKKFMLHGSNMVWVAKGETLDVRIYCSNSDTKLSTASSAYSPTIEVMYLGE